MKYTAIVAVAVLSLILAIPLSRQPAKQQIDLSFKPVAAKVVATPVVKSTVTHKIITPAVPTPAAPPPAPITPAPIPPPCETHECWMTEAGIAPSDFAAVDYIVSHESGWNPNATEPYSGAHGLPQALPYSKTGCGWVDAICQLQWANTYAVTRFGGWWPAQAYWALHRNW